MAVNKVVYGSDTLIDLTEDTVTADKVKTGYTFHAANGVLTTGTGLSVDSVNGMTGDVVLDASDVGALPDDTTIPSKTSDLTNDSGFITGMTILSYGSSTWNDFLTAYQAKKVVYCRASSNSNPASGSQTRLAFMAYVNNAESPTEVEFQYYRSVSSHSATQQGDQVYVYKITSSGSWTVTVREAYSAVAAGTGLSRSYSNGTTTLYLTLAVQNSLEKADSAYQLPASGIPDSDIASAATWNAAYQLPSGGIPDTDIASASTWNAKTSDSSISASVIASILDGTYGA